MPERPHLAYPVELHGTRLLEVEQDSDRDVADCVAVILTWPQGTRQGMPEFGVPVEAFDSGGPDLGALRDAVTLSEPRATALRDSLIEERMRGGLGRVRFEFDQTGSEGE